MPEINVEKIRDLYDEREATKKPTDDELDEIIRQKKFLYLAEQRVLWKQKEEYLEQFFERIEPYDFYRTIFPEGSFERKGEYDDQKPNGIYLEINGERRFNHIITDDLDELVKNHGDAFVIAAPCSYIGKKRTGKSCRWIYGLVIDLDYVGMPQLRDVIHQSIHIDFIPKPTFLVNSGTGIHFYFIFEEPIQAYPNVQRWLKSLKRALTELIWNMYTSTSSDLQFQGVVQGYRIVGSKSKLGKKYPVTAWDIGGEKVTIEYLMSFLEHERKEDYDNLLKTAKSQAKITLAEATKKWPDWAEHKDEGEKKQYQYRQRWTCNPALYHWWLNRIRGEAKYHHRFYCLMCLAIYAVKCGIDEDTLYEDAFSLLDRFEGLTDEDPFTEDDIVSALESYQDSYATFPRYEIETLSGLSIPPNKRNGRSQKQHMVIMSAVRDALYPDGEWRNKEGRPKGSGTAQSKVEQWQIDNPSGTKKQCKDATGLSYHTIRKWWTEPAEKTDS